MATNRAARRKAQAASTRSAVKADTTPIDTTGTETVAPKRRIVRSADKAQEKALAEAKANSERINKAIEHTSLLKEIPGFPFNERPWGLNQGEGVIVLAEDAPTDSSPTGGTVLVELDAGAFRWLWEGTEARALDNYRRYEGSMPDISAAGQRALRAMRAAGHANFGSKYPHLHEAPTKRRIVRKSKSNAEETDTPTKKRVVKRKTKS